MLFTPEGINARVYISYILLSEFAAPVSHLAYVHLFRLNKYSSTHNLAHMVCSKQVLFKGFI